jgi:hypothetical protein
VERLAIIGATPARFGQGAVLSGAISTALLMTIGQVADARGPHPEAYGLPGRPQMRGT